eukprot:364539-Chlamydomonas_euryale.AAC.8
MTDERRVDMIRIERCGLLRPCSHACATPSGAAHPATQTGRVLRQGGGSRERPEERVPKYGEPTRSVRGFAHAQGQSRAGLRATCSLPCRGEKPNTCLRPLVVCTQAAQEESTKRQLNTEMIKEAIGARQFISETEVRQQTGVSPLVEGKQRRYSPAASYNSRPLMEANQRP